jgi:hypothetical protein
VSRGRLHRVLSGCTLWCSKAVTPFCSASQPGAMLAWCSKKVLTTLRLSRAKDPCFQLGILLIPALLLYTTS